MVYVILLRPKEPGNIGAVARVMKNFGFENLVLVNPCCSHTSDEAKARAKHAQDVLKNTKATDESFFSGLDYLVGTTSKLGSDYNIPRIPLTPGELSQKLNKKTKTGILFGPEDRGLNNKEIEKCDLLVNIPANEKYTSLNISHATAILLYEMSKRKSFGKKPEPANKDYMNNIMEYLNYILDTLSFSTKEKKETQIKTWKRIFGRAQLTKREAFVVFGFLKKICNELKKKK